MLFSSMQIQHQHVLQCRASNANQAKLCIAHYACVVLLACWTDAWPACTTIPASLEVNLHLRTGVLQRNAQVSQID